MDESTRLLIDELLREVSALKARVAFLEAENAELRAKLSDTQQRLSDTEAKLSESNRRLAEAEGRAARQAAPFRRRESKRKPDQEKKPPGREKGHPGACRVVPDHIDQEVDVPLDSCPQCGGEVSKVNSIEQFIEEIPPVRPMVTRLRTYSGICSHCGPVRSRHPLQTSTGGSKVQLGPRALAVAAALNKEHGLTMRKTCRVLADLAGLRLTAGGLSQAIDRIADKMSEHYQQLVEDIRQAPAVFADETSWWVGGPGYWLWTFTSAQTTLYVVDESRGSDVVIDVLGDKFAGMLVSDCLASYDRPAYRKHKCIAHHLKAISQACEQPGTKDQSYLRQWKLFFTMVIVLARSREKMVPEDFNNQRSHIEQWRDRLLGQTVEQFADKAIQKRLSKQSDHLIGCLYEPAADPTNNAAERSLRPAVIARKVSCGNKTIRGKQSWETITSLAVTCRQRGQDLITYLQQNIPVTAMAS